MINYLQYLLGMKYIMMTAVMKDANIEMNNPFSTSGDNLDAETQLTGCKVQNPSLIYPVLIEYFGYLTFID
jgi:hypothetical protein